MAIYRARCVWLLHEVVGQWVMGHNDSTHDPLTHCLLCWGTTPRVTSQLKFDWQLLLYFCETMTNAVQIFLPSLASTCSCLLSSYSNANIRQAFPSHNMSKASNFQPGIISKGSALERRSHCRKAAGTHGEGGVHAVKVFKNALWTALRTIFRPKMH